MATPYFSSYDDVSTETVHEKEGTYPPPPVMDKQKSRMKEKLYDGTSPVTDNSILFASELESKTSKFNTIGHIIKLSKNSGGTCFLPENAADIIPNVCQYIGADKMEKNHVCVVPKAHASKNDVEQYNYSETDRSYILNEVDETTCSSL